MNKSNKQNSLQQGLKKLPVYDPPESVWNNVANSLVLRGGIEGLPEYEPSEKSWGRIEKRLVSAKRKHWQKWAIAATILIVICGNWWVNQQLAPSDFTYSTEIVEAKALQINWETDQTVLSQIISICEAKKGICTDDEFQDLEFSLQELDEAKNELKVAIATYGVDMELLTQLEKVERERTAVLKEMMGYLL
ncbi:MAG: hypothetical protein AAF960_21685 [Bacteroidota bacterium]